VLDGAVFAGSIHCLKDQKGGPLMLCAELVLQITQFVNDSLERGRGVLL